MPRHRKSDAILPWMVVLGGAAVALWIAKQAANAGDVNASGTVQSGMSVLSNVGTPFANGSLFGSYNSWTGQNNIDTGFPLIRYSISDSVANAPMPLWRSTSGY